MSEGTLDRSAIFVDAGYLFASGSKLIAGERQTRSQLHLDHEQVLKLLSSLSDQLSGLPLLRVYWYDGASAGPNPGHVALAYRPNLKLRLGPMDEKGQCGVDALIARDIVALPYNHATAYAVQLSV